MSSAIINTTTTTINIPAHNDVTSFIIGPLEFKTYYALLGVNLLTVTISTFGIGANIINVIVFIKQGFAETINISLMCLTISDLSTLVLLIFMSICNNPWHDFINFPFDPIDMGYTASWFFCAWTYNSCWLAAFIAFERCLCITRPLDVKRIITPRVTKIVVGIILFACLVSPVPFLSTVSSDYVFNPATNRTVLNLVFSADRRIVNLIVRIVSILHQGGSYTCLLVATIALVVSFKKNVEWRKTTSVTAGKESAGTGMSERDKRLVKTVVLISVVILLCITPCFTFCFLSLVEPEFDIRSQLERVFTVIWSFCSLPYSINSTVNIFIYLSMSTKYRVTFYALFGRKEK